MIVREVYGLRVGKVIEVVGAISEVRRRHVG